jgi:DNA-binding NarL/FixJ family response regulator
MANLTKAETKVIALLAHGEPNKVIAYRLGLSENTVGKHVARIFCKLGVTNRVQAALDWHRIGWRDNQLLTA